MSSTTLPVYKAPLLPLPTAVPSQESVSGSHEHMDLCDMPSPFDVTSNIRQGFPSPTPPSPKHHQLALQSHIGSTIPCDAIYELPEPDLTPRFVFRQDEPSDEEMPPVLFPDGAYTPCSSIQPLFQKPTSPLPRIYFGSSAITFVPPVCYDNLERDPSVKAVPRNYRAWMRAGRPKLDVEGLERAEAKHDFLAMGLSFPQDTESEGSGDEKEKERRRKRKKRAAARALMVPIERPRRMVRKIRGADTPTEPTVPTTSSVDKESEDITPQFDMPVPILDETADGLLSNPADRSDSSERRSSSTLLELDTIVTKSKSKRLNSEDQELRDVPAKKPRISERLYIRKNPPPQVQEISSSEERATYTNSSLSDLTPTPEPVLPTNPSESPIIQHNHMDFQETVDTSQKSGQERLCTALPEPPLSREPSKNPFRIARRPVACRTIAKALPRNGQDRSRQGLQEASLLATESQSRSGQSDSTLDAGEPSRSAQSHTSPQRGEGSPGTESKFPIIQDRLRPGRRTLARSLPTENPPQSIYSLSSRPGHRANRDHHSRQSTLLQMRTFPASIPIIPGYSGFYRRYPLITQFDKDDPLGKYIIPDESQTKRSLGVWNHPHEPRDLYTPRYTKGSGNKKIALCPICYEDQARGGEGRQEWNHTKTSQHNYHMQYYHGISATNYEPFSPPIAQRTVPVARPQSNEKSEILQGKCHNCKQWIPLEGCKVGDLKVKELFWWKHAAGCHKESKISGEADIFIEDGVYRRLQEYEAIYGTSS